MAIELHSFTVTLAAADATGCASAAEHRARIWKAVSELSAAVRNAGMATEARFRGQDRQGHVLFEATDTGAAFLRGLPVIARVDDARMNGGRVQLRH
ncbi:hypothetical protein [Azospirillum endophyticum]